MILDKVDSTNAYLSRSTGPTPFWCLALDQTSGKGRRGRAWGFQPGNFAASVRVSPKGTVAEFARYSFVTALALHDALAALTRADDKIALKWPNDVLLDGRKACGILLETAGTDLIIGIGVNLIHTPDSDVLDALATTPGNVLDSLGVRLEPEIFLDVLATAFSARQNQLEGDGFTSIRRDWLARAMGLGTHIRARLPHVTHEGVFEDIDADGALILRQGAARLVLPAADVYFAGE